MRQEKAEVGDCPRFPSVLLSAFDSLKAGEQ